MAQTLGNLSLGSATRVGAAIARFAGMRTNLHRRAIRNLAFAMPELGEDQREQILLGMFDHFTRTIIEYLYLKKMSTEVGQFEVSVLDVPKPVVHGCG